MRSFRPPKVTKISPKTLDFIIVLDPTRAVLSCTWGSCCWKRFVSCNTANLFSPWFLLLGMLKGQHGMYFPLVICTVMTREHVILCIFYFNLSWYFLIRWNQLKHIKVTQNDENTRKRKESKLKIWCNNNLSNIPQT